jgi:hypothetical protein
MKKWDIYLFMTFLGLFIYSGNTFSQIGYTVLDEPDFEIKQKFEYVNPSFDRSKEYEPVELGPSLSFTYVSDSLVKTISDLNKIYLKGKVWMPDEWPKEIKIEGAIFKVAKFENGYQMPILQTIDGTVFSFLIEEDLLAFDVKNTYTKDDVLKVKYDTVEIEK